jgi:hypothetical protein
MPESAGVTEENHEKISQDIDVPAKIQTELLRNTNQKRYFFSQLALP